MSDSQSRLDEIFAIFKTHFGDASRLLVDEPFASDKPAGVEAPLRALTLLAAERPFALFGLTKPVITPLSPPFVAYLARRARARRVTLLDPLQPARDRFARYTSA